MCDYRILWNAALLLFVSFFMGTAVFADEIPSKEITDQQQLTVVEQKMLKGAIEDFEFQERAKAIETLEKLRQNHPTNLRVLRYLGLSYEESKRFAEAQGVFSQWIKYGDNRMDADARFAWVGMAKAYDKTKHTAMGIKLLRSWLAKHPDDYDAVVALGDMMVREKDYDGTKSMFKSMLSKKDVPANYQASAHYYLGFIAWLEGDVNEVRAQGDRVLRVEPEGGFASVIKQLMATPPPRRLGLNVTAGLDGFYVDNVESKPTYNLQASVNDRSAGVSASLGLTWNFRHHLAANYNYSGTFYSKRRDLNLGLHMVGLTWADKGLQVGPRYEFVTLYDKMLYKGLGMDLGWGNGTWMVVGSVRYKSFTRGAKVLQFNAQGVGSVVKPAPSLAGLGGWSNTLMVMRMANWGKSIWMLGANVAFERTKGVTELVSVTEVPVSVTEVINNRKSTDYNQIGVSINLMYPDGSMLYMADINGYIKKYRDYDRLGARKRVLRKQTQQVPLFTRKDEYIHLGAGATWTPEGQTHHALSLKTEWNNNNSNYDFPNNTALAPSAAAYAQWKHTIGYAYTW